jgi:hypothetical protein
MKNPELLADPLYLQEEERIVALLMVMTLCLLVYSALQWRIRQGMKEKGESEGESNSNADSTVGLSELRRDSCALCRAAARDLEHERAPPNGSIRSGAELRTALCISPDIRGAEDGFCKKSSQFSVRERPGAICPNRFPIFATADRRQSTTGLGSGRPSSFSIALWSGSTSNSMSGARLAVQHRNFYTG